VYNGSLAPAKMQRKQILNSLQAGQFSVSWNNTTPHHTM
jgi:predicted carbohydrate-binding protein with CBM5 and CBM33 domain